ncbi:hypothetical protein [Bosea caraganae]|uniref:hypothetical protein n=1 Tax=Bosea caraganae TaxID=2763117 RepID=UPI0015F0C190|nr:hypothetical protein [Bosea caraganae]
MSQLYASLRSAVDDAAEALDAVRVGESSGAVDTERFLAASQRVAALAREIAAILDR